MAYSSMHYDITSYKFQIIIYKTSQKKIQHNKTVCSPTSESIMSIKIILYKKETDYEKIITVEFYSVLRPEPIYTCKKLQIIPSCL
jgi:hypothetical protein